MGNQQIGGRVETDGFAIVEGVLSRTTVEHLLTSLEHIGDTGSVRKRGGIFAVRNLLDVSSEVRELAHSKAIRVLVEPVLGKGFGPWSMKADVLHVQSPAEVLEHMVSVQLHLDNCGEENGVLRVIPGSHLHGRISMDDISAMRETHEVVCAVGVGGALLIRPLLLHASSPSRVAGRRRVVHLDFTSVQLPNGMRWFSEAA